MGHLDDLGSVRPIKVWDGVIARTVDGERLSLGIVELEPDSVVPEHSHENEQLGMVLAGSLEFRVGDETRVLTAGGTWRIPPGVPHEVRTGPDGAVAIDVFAPARADWQALEKLPPQPPRWP